MGSWSAFGSVAGILLGSAVGAVITSVLSAEAVQRWGWRVPFLAGLAVGLTGLYIRRHLPEVSTRPAAATPPASPVREAFRTEWRAMLRVAGLNVLPAVGFYMMFVYVVTYLQQVVHVQTARALDINTLLSQNTTFGFHCGGGLLTARCVRAITSPLSRRPASADHRERATRPDNPANLA